MNEIQRLTTATLLGFTILWAGTAHAATAFFQYERSAGYDRKHCFYSYMGNEYVITIPKLRNCPLTIEVNP